MMDEFYSFFTVILRRRIGFTGNASDKESTYQCRRYKRQVPSLGQEDPLEEKIATHSSTLTWTTPWTEESGGQQSMRLQRVGRNWAQHNTVPFHADFCCILEEAPYLSCPWMEFSPSSIANVDFNPIFTFLWWDRWEFEKRGQSVRVKCLFL